MIGEALSAFLFKSSLDFDFTASRPSLVAIFVSDSHGNECCVFWEVANSA